MKRHLTTPLLIAVILAAAIGCGKHPFTPEHESIAKGIVFSTQITGTRAYGNVWEASDTIGVYMVPSPQPPADETDEGTDDGTDTGTGTGTAPTGWRALDAEDIHANMAYVTDLPEGEHGMTVAFTGADEQNTLSWPNDGSAVDFVAYYPRLPTDSIVDFVYPVRLARQDPQRAIDLMWSDNLRGVSADGGESMLLFRHRLTKLLFNITDINGESLEGMTATISGLPSQAGFDLSTGTLTIEEPETPEEPEDAEGTEGTEEEDDVIENEPRFEPFDAVLTACSDGDEDGVKERAVVEAIVLPGEELDYDVTFTLENGDKAVFHLADVTYLSGKRYIYNLRLTASAGEVEFYDTTGEDDTESIFPWDDETVDVDEPIIREPEDKPVPPREEEEDDDDGSEWSSGPLTKTSTEYSLTSTAIGNDFDDRGYLIMGAGTATVKMSSFTGDITSIGVNAEYTGNGFGTAGEVSVKVGGTSLIVEGNEGNTHSNNTAVYIKNSNEGEFIFVTKDGNPLKGEIEIKILYHAGTTLWREFSINPI